MASLFVLLHLPIDGKDVIRDVLIIHDMPVSIGSSNRSSVDLPIFGVRIQDGDAILTKFSCDRGS